MNKRLGVQLITFITALLFIFTALTFTVQSVPPVTQNTIIVDITGNGDYTSIKEAISNAAVTDIIYIREGTYNEHSIDVNKKIQITGEDPQTTIINSSGNIAFIITSSYVDISNLQIINTGEFAIDVQSGSTGCTISNCIIDTKFRGTAIDLKSSYNKVTNCNLIGFDNSRQGVKIRGSFNVVENCNIQDFSNGVLVISSSHRNRVTGCSIINNENAVDIRANSNNNIVNNCNIYSNLQSIKIWDGSDHNNIYLNNFWKNDIDAIDERNNTWDNGERGNYWDRYQGSDSNGDGIGDASHKVSEGIYDRYPLITMILPDYIIPPSDLRKTTSNSDNTPTFAWNPSVYSEAIVGYYVKIDNTPEISIGDTTTWTSPNPLSEGVHRLSVRGEAADEVTSEYSTLTFSIDTSITDTDGDGWSDEEEQRFDTDPLNPSNYPLDTDNDRTPDSIDTDDDNDRYSDEMEAAYGTDATNPTNYPPDTDGDFIPDDDSPDGEYAGDADDDNDGLTDSTERTLGTSPTRGSDVTKIFIGGNSYYLIDVTRDGTYDALYEPTSGKTTGVEKRGEDYFIDSNGDGSLDHKYQTADGSVSAYEEEFTVPPAILLLIVLAVAILALFLVPRYLKDRLDQMKLRRKHARAIKRPTVEKTLKLPLGETRDTVIMIGQTKTLLQNIQRDVDVYMEKLSQIEDQFTVMPKEEEIQVSEPPKEEPEDIHEPDMSKETETPEEETLESKVDKLLSSLDDKDKKD
jgi:nitrous oxidase accessory protein NosD